jgi:hypothetical protein
MYAYNSIDSGNNLNWDFMSFADTIFVGASATGANDGTNWTNAYKYLQDALADANSNPCINEIWVAEGTYYPDANSANPSGTGDRNATFRLIDGVAIYGGFIGVETSLSQQSWEANKTILSGDLAGDDSTGGNNSENSYHVVTANGVSATAVLDGFMITAGNADGNTPDYFAGGMYNISASPTVANCLFVSNSASETGGGMLNSDSNPKIINCSFRNNVARVGSGLHNVFGTPTIIDCIFTGNSAVDPGIGGGVSNAFSNPLLINCVFVANSVSATGSAIWNHDSNTTVINCTFSSNLGGDAIRGATDSNITMTNCIVWNDSISTTGTDTITYSNIQGGWSGAGNINNDPCFVRAPNDGGDGWGDDPITAGVDEGANDDFGDLHLMPGSPCIDAGDNSAVPADIADLDNDGNTTEPIPWDIDGDMRVIDGNSSGTATVDMGFDEVIWDGVQGMAPEDPPVTLNPGGGPNDPNVETLVVFDNNSVTDANVTVVEMNTTVNPPEKGFQTLGSGRTLRVDTSLANGEFLMTVVIPFEAGDLPPEADPTAVDLMYWDTSSDDWQLAVKGNSEPVGTRWREIAPDDPPPTLETLVSRPLSDYGIFWGPATAKGFVWANVDHATDFEGFAHNIADLDLDGDVDLRDFAVLGLTWLLEDGDIGYNSVCDISNSADHIIDEYDLKIFADNWLAGK